MSVYKKIHTNSAEETEKAGAQLARDILADKSAPRFIALKGDLGVGKTVFVRGFVSEIAPEAAVRSPTFALVNEYRAGKGKTSVFHFDVYRIVDEDDLYSIGFYDYLDRDGICLVEWSENIPYAFPEEYFTVTIEKDDPDQPDSRSVTVCLDRK